jgi:hypothetical protein
MKSTVFLFNFDYVCSSDEYIQSLCKRGQKSELYQTKKADVQQVSTHPGICKIMWSWNHVKLKPVLKSCLSQKLDSKQAHKWWASCIPNPNCERHIIAVVSSLETFYERCQTFVSAFVLTHTEQVGVFIGKICCLIFCLCVHTCILLVSPSLTQLGEIDSVYPELTIIVSIGLRKPMLNRNPV